MDKLTALPVKGESFLLRRKDFTILVDGGYGSKPLLAALSKLREPVTHVDVVVCTHADNDHAGGLTTLLDTGRLTVGEFWLPGSWSDSVPTLLLEPGRALNVLVNDLRDVSQEHPVEPGEVDDPRFHGLLKEIAARELEEGVRGREQPAERVAERRLERREREPIRGEVGNDGQRPQRRFEQRRPRESEELESLRERLEDIQTASDGMPRRLLTAKASVRHVVRSRGLHPQWQEYWLTLIDTLARIRKVAEQAVKHHVPIIWFDYTEFAKTRLASGGIHGLLVPMNAVQLTTPPSPAMRFWALLSVVNQESLVFCSRPDDGAAVMFAADSPLGDGPGFQNSFLPGKHFCREGLVVTAPHHGSDSNAIAYDHIEDATCRPALFVRSGGKPSHPGTVFRQLPKGRRTCTHCPHRGLEHREVEILLSSQYWRFGNLRVAGHECDCPPE